jgi:copper homeostasis protein
MSPVVVEVVVDSVAGAIAAQEGGAQRVELCANLFEGGTTPSAASIEVARRHLSIDLQVMIRPRGGDFLYTDLEMEVMVRDIAIAKELGANGLVFGVLQDDASIDIARTKTLIDAARPLNVTFHRAFDMVADPHHALYQLLGLGVERLLTSGLEATALEGVDLIRELVQQADGRLIVMPGGGVHERNVARIVRATGVQEVHLSARHHQPSHMHYQSPHVALGGLLRPPDYTLATTSVARVRAGIAAAHRATQPDTGA